MKSILNSNAQTKPDPHCIVTVSITPKTTNALQVIHLQGIALLFGSGNRTRTCDLWVMSPTSYQLLHPALFGNTKVI